MIRKIALAAILFLLSGHANGQPRTTCLLSTTGVSFGEIQFAKTNSTATGAIVISCIGRGNVDYDLRLTAGSNGTYTPREMPLTGSSSNTTLPYNLYSQTSLSSIWGNGTSGTVDVSGTIRLGNGSAAFVPLAVYGRVEARSAPAAGNYADIIIATLNTPDAANVSIPLNVTANVSNHCNISATNLNFADYTQAQLDGQSEIHVTCTDGTPYQVGLDGGRYPGGTVSRRSMSGPGPSQLDYQLYSDSARTAVWGDRVGSDTVSGTGNGIPQRLDVYGRIPAGQDRIRDGGYVDTITATITF